MAFAKRETVVDAREEPVTPIPTSRAAEPMRTRLRMLGAMPRIVAKR